MSGWWAVSEFIIFFIQGVVMGNAQLLQGGQHKEQSGTEPRVVLWLCDIGIKYGGVGMLSA